MSWMLMNLVRLDCEDKLRWRMNDNELMSVQLPSKKRENAKCSD